MASFDTETFLIDAADPDDLVEVLDEVAEAAGAWVNVEPDVDDALRTHVSGLFAWFSARGTQVPVGTFVAGTGRDVPSIGVDHGSGRGAGDRLREAGLSAPDGWSLRQDHPKRGLVWEASHEQSRLTDSTGHGPLAQFLMEATVLFCPLPTDGRFRISVHTPRR